MSTGIECIDNIENLLRDLGLKSISRINDRKLRVTVEPKPGVRYVVYLIAHDERVFIEAIASKSVSGNNKSLRIFYETLLTYNSSVFPFSFAFAKVQDNSLQIILRYSPSCNNIDALDLKFSIESLNETFTVHLPRIKDLADEYGLKFTGHDEFNIVEIVKEIIGI